MRRWRSGAGLSAVLLVMGALAGCGSGGPTTASANTNPAGQAPRSTNYAAVAVAADHAVVADGTVPTRFSVADLTSSDPTATAPLAVPSEMLFLHIGSVGHEVLIAGNACDGGATTAGAEIICSPGTAMLVVYDPESGTFRDIDLGRDGLRFASATFPASDSGVTLVNALVREGDAPETTRELLSVDVQAGSVTQLPLPDGSLDDDDTEEELCQTADGVRTFFQAASSENVPGAPDSRMWTSTAEDPAWTEVVPPDSGEAAWHTSGCRAGSLTLTTVDADAVSRVLYDPVADHFSELAAQDWDDDAAYGGMVDDPVGDRVWLDGQIWRFDIESGTFENTGAPAAALEGVRASAAWGTDAVVALIDSGGPIDREHEMQLSLALVDAP